MKNLKRVLSLGLASVMLLGMMVMGASAKDFTDAEDIVHTEAVETMVALKVINGKEDGSFFDPKGTVTRAEMAKMIAVAMNGGSEANTGVKTNPTFTDISGHWAAGWIEYCADMKIINGRGDGTFDPNGQVTGVEALKMVLTALGYDAEAYKLVGASWAAQTLERARNTGNVKLVDELADVVMTEPATRDTAAQMIWNGLQAYVVTTAPEQNTNSGEVTWRYGTTTTTLLKQRYDADIAVGEYYGNYNYSNDQGALKGEIIVKEIPTLANGTPGTPIYHVFPSALSIDNAGEEVKIVWKDGAKGIKGQADNKDVIYGCFNTGATRVVRSQLSKIKDNKNSKNQLNIDGVKYDCDTSVEITTNYDATNGVVTRNTAGSDAGSGDNSPLTKALKFNSGWPFKATFDTNGKINKIFVTQTYGAIVTAINSTNITLNNGVNSLKIEDHDIEEGLKKGDIVAVTPMYDIATIASGVVTVKKADKVSGEVTGYKGTGAGADENVIMGGKTYKNNYKNLGSKPATANDMKYVTNLGLAMLASTSDVTTIPSFYVSANPNRYIGKDVDLYLVDGYVVAAVETTKSATNYSIITEVKEGTAGATFSGLQLQVMGADGTKEIISVSKDSSETAGAGTRTQDGAIKNDDYKVGDIITYSFDKNDLAEVVVEAQMNTSSSVSYGSRAKVVTEDGVDFVTASDCVLFTNTKSVGVSYDDKLYTKAEWEAYDIRDLDNFASAASAMVAVAKDDDNKVVAVFVDLKNIPNGAEDDTVYGVITKYNGRVKDYYTYTIQSNGETYEVSSKDNTSVLNERYLVKFRPTADNTYAAGKIEVVGKSMVLVDGSNYNEGYVKEYNSKDNTLSYWVAVNDPDSDGAYEGTGTVKTYALDKDAKIIYVDQDAKTSAGEASIDAFNAINHKPNVAFVTKTVDGVEVINVLFVEISGKSHVQRVSGENLL